MAFLGKEFDATTVEPSAPRGVIPPGWYTALIEASDVKKTKKAIEAEQYGSAGTGDRLLELNFKITEGEYKGSLVWERLNIINSNPTAQEIAEKSFSALCHAIGKMRIKDSSELHFIPMQISVGVEAKEGYDPRNVIKGYKAIGEKSANPTGTATATPAGAKAAPAWAKK